MKLFCTCDYFFYLNLINKTDFKIVKVISIMNMVIWLHGDNDGSGVKGYVDNVSNNS